MRSVRALAPLLGLLIATSCESAEEIADAGLVWQAADPGSWVEIARLEGTFTSHLPENPNLTCGRGAVCDPRSFEPFRTYRGPYRVRCSGDPSYLVVAGGDLLSDEPPDLADGVGFGCYPPPSRIPQDYISFMEDGQAWGLYLSGVHQRDESILGYGESASYSISVQVWKGPWREPVCGRDGSGHPDGNWFTCISKDSVEERWTSGDSDT